MSWRRISNAIGALVLVLLAAQPCRAQVAFGAGAAGGWSGTAGPVDTDAFTIGAGATNVLVCLAQYVTPIPETITTMVWDPTPGVNEALTPVGTVQSSGNRRAIPYIKINPTAGASKVVRTTWGGAALGSQTVHCAYFTGAHQTTPVPTGAGNIVTATGTGTAVSVDVSNASADDMVMDLMGISTGSMTMGADQNLIGSKSPGDVTRSSYQDGVNAGVMSWTSDSSQSWFTMGVRIVPAAAGAATNAPNCLLTHLCVP